MSDARHHVALRKPPQVGDRVIVPDVGEATVMRILPGEVGTRDPHRYVVQGKGWRAIYTRRQLAAITPRSDIVCLHPDPDLPDPKRGDRFRAKGGVLFAMLVREKLVAERREQRERVKTINAPVAPGPDGKDHGMDLGPAALARGATETRVGGHIRGAAQRKAEPIKAMRVPDVTLFDRMHRVAQLNDRQHRAGRRLQNLWRAAGLNASVSARYPGMLPSVEDDDGEDLPDRDPDGGTPLDAHRKLMRQLPAHMAALLDTACMWLPERPTGHPGVRFLATFQEALDQLADIWGMKRGEDRA